MSSGEPSLWRSALASLVIILAVGGTLAALWPAPRAHALTAERPTIPSAPPAPSQVPTSKPCGGRPEKPAICFKRFSSAGDRCFYECAPLASNDGWLVSERCVSPDPEPDAKVLP